MTSTLTPPGAAPAHPPTPTPRPVPRRALRIPRRPKDFRPSDLGLLLATAAAAFSIVWIVFDQLTLLSGVFGFIVCLIGTFLFLYWVVNLQLYGRQMAADRFVGALVTLGALAMFTPLVLLTGYLVVKGAHLLSLHVFFATQKGATGFALPGQKVVEPGVAHAIVGTFEQVAIAAAIGVPAALLTAIYLNEVGGRFTQWVRIVVTAMSGVPAIVAGIFIYSMWIVQFHEGFSGLAGALALVVILLPTVTRGTEEVLKVVPNEYREASKALAASDLRTTWSVVLPTARSGIVTAVLLGIAVALGETAPLLVTIFGNTNMNWNVFHGPQSALSLLAYTEVRLPQQNAIDLAYTAALVLFMLVFLIFVLGRIFGSQWASRHLRRRRGGRGGSAGLTNVAARGVIGEYGVVRPSSGGPL